MRISTLYGIPMIAYLLTLAQSAEPPAWYRK